MNEAQERVSQQPRKPRGKLGTFGGVFTPSILTILGIILFLRCGWMVGNVGLQGALVMVALAHSVSVLTSVSLAAIATNLRVRAGGDYFLISRSLGLEYGGALGIVLFLAQSVSVAFYCFGFGEAVAALLPEAPYVSARSLGAAAALMLFLIAYIGADLATRFQYVIMVAITAALVSFFWGAGSLWNVDLISSNWTAPESNLGFWPVFAVFFPAVTGFTQGVSMSGDLREPSRSLPKGTFAAVGLSIVTYTAAAVTFAAVEPVSDLQADFLAFKRVSAFAPLFDAGVIAATLSSALASFLGAPRILQAMAKDNIFPLIGPFRHGHGPSENPRRGVILTAGIAVFVLAVGNLNAVAGIISMFFLISYGLLNYATYVAAKGASPSFRPRFRFFHHRASLAGGILCLGAILAIDAVSGAMALTVVAVLYQYLKRSSVPARWADSRRAYQFSKLKDTIAEIDRTPETEWTWQPHVLAVTEIPERRDLVVRFGCWLSGTSGFTTAVGVVRGGPDAISTQLQRREAEEKIREDLEALGLDALPLVFAAPDLQLAVETLVQTWGIGPVRANTALIDWMEQLPESSPGRDPSTYGRQIRGLVMLGCNVAVLDITGKEWRQVQATPSDQRRIDVWWWENPSSRLSLLFAYLMTRAEEWQDAKIKIMVPCSEASRDKVEAELTRMLDDARIDAELVAVCDADSAQIVEISQKSSTVFLPMEIKANQLTDPFGGSLDTLLRDLPMTCLVAADRDLRLTIGPEPGHVSASEETPAEAKTHQ